MILPDDSPQAVSWQKHLRRLVASGSGVFAVLAAGPVAGEQAAPPAVTVEWNNERQRVDGFGGSAAWYGAKVVTTLAATELARLIQLLYDPQEGIGLSLLRVRIPPDAYPAETKQHDWANDRVRAKAAFIKAVQDAYHPVTLATPWTPPAWMKESGQTKGGSLTPAHYDDYARYLVDWVAGLQQQFGVRIDVLSAQNEPGKKPWESCEWQQPDFVRFFTQHLAPARRARKLPVQLAAAEWTGWDDKWINAVLADPVGRETLGVAAAHTYWNGFRQLRPFPQVRAAGKQLWMTEHYFEGAAEDDLHRGLINAKEIHELFTVAEVNAYFYWWLFAAWDKGEAATLIRLRDNQLVVTPKLYVIGQFSRFVRPGWRRVVISQPNPATDVFVTAFQGTNGAAVVLTNLSKKDTPLTLEIGPRPFTPYRTSGREQLMPLPDLQPVAGRLTLTLPARSITTLTTPTPPSSPATPAAAGAS